MHAHSCGFFGGTTFSPTCCSDCSCSSHQSSWPRFISFPHSFNNSGWWKYSHNDDVSAPLLALRACECLFCRDRVEFGKLEIIFLLTWLRWENCAVVWGTDVSEPPPFWVQSCEHRGKGNQAVCLPEVERVSVSRWADRGKERDETRLWIKWGKKAGKRWREGMVRHAVAAQSR